MNFQQLEYIVAVDQLKHFAKAAESCHITQATLSAMIKKLEEELNIIIFDRKKQPIVTTAEGEQVIAIAKNILSLQFQLKGLKEIRSEDISGKIKIGIIPTIANSLLPIILKPLLSNFPKLRIEIIEITTEEIKRQLLLDQIDVGLLATPLEHSDFEENILYYEAMMVYGVTGNDKKYILPHEMEDQNIWLLEDGHCFRNQSMTICNIKEKALVPTNLKFEGSSFETLLNLTDQFGGYTLIPELYYNLMPEHKKNKTKHFEKPLPVREISAVYYRPYAKRKMIDLVSEQIKTLIKGHLSTEKFSAKDLSIIGI